MQQKKEKSFDGKRIPIAYERMKLAEFMREHLVGRGTQARFARKAHISTATVSKWAQGEMERAPNFENCIRIAIYFDVPPLEVFAMAERSEYAALFRELFPNYETSERPSKSDNEAGLCQKDPRHRTLQIMLDEILDSETEWARLISGNVVSLHSSYTGEPPDLSLVVGGEPQHPGGSPSKRGRPKIKVTRDGK